MKHFDTFAIMLDCSRNAVMTVPSIKKMILIMEKIGYNALMLYTEDTYEIDGEPYFGYMRGRYSKSELKEIAHFGQEHGIEVIPCIQTLAHLNAIFHHACYESIHDCDDILLLDEPKTYELIQKMIDTCKECFLTKKIHIGMDEAFMFGYGKYREKHGDSVNRIAVLAKHLDKVKAMCSERGLKPMMWGDMPYRLAYDNAYFSENPHIDLSPKAKAAPGVNLVYWDYYHLDSSYYEGMIDRFKKLSDDALYFAGGAWVWAGFLPLLSRGEKVSKAAIEACINKGVRNFIMTCWLDNGAECSIFSSLSTLYYAYQVAEGITDMNAIKEGFSHLFGISYDSWKLLETPNYITNAKEPIGNAPINPTKYLLFNDPLLGQFDNGIDVKDDELFAEKAKVLKRISKEAGEYGYLFEYAAALSDVLAIKNSLGVKMRTAYLSKDKAALMNILPLIDECLVRLNALEKAFRIRWLKEAKPQGLEVAQIRFGGLANRLKEAKERINEYLLGSIDSIPELDEERLPISGNEEGDKNAKWFNDWIKNASTNVI